MFANRILNTILISADKQAAVLKASAIGLAISISAHLILVRAYGATGAGISALITEAGLFVMFLPLTKFVLTGSRKG